MRRENKQEPWSSKEEFCSAFTVAELGEMLPTDSSIMTGVLQNKWRIYPWGAMSGDDKYDSVASLKFNHFDSDTEADARAKLLIHLLETNIIPPSVPPNQKTG